LQGSGLAGLGERPVPCLVYNDPCEEAFLAKPSEVDLRQVGGMKGKIIIIDDNEAIVEMLQRKLEKEDYEVLGCVKSAKAVGECLKAKPDLIILDILMPGKSGWEIMQELKSDPVTQATPVIISTVKNRPEDMEQGKDLQAADYITKPYVFSDLLEKVQKILGKP